MRAIRTKHGQAGNRNSGLPIELQRLCYAMGYYFQVQDDFLDCFGDATVTGKEGTDIQDGKCTWHLINALASIQMNGKEWKMTEENYGKLDRECVNRVKAMYSTLNLERRYEEFEIEAFGKLNDEIDRFPLIPLRPLFSSLLAELHHRKK